MAAARERTRGAAWVGTGLSLSQDIYSATVTLFNELDHSWHIDVSLVRKLNKGSAPACLDEGVISGTGSQIRRRSGKGESPERSGQKQRGRACRLLAPAAPFLDPCLFCVSVSGAPQKSLAIEQLLFVQDNTEINRGV